MYTQADRPLAITTPLGEDALLVTCLRGYEAISQPFNFQVELLAEVGTEISFERIVGQAVTVEMQLISEEKRYFNGVVKRFSQGIGGGKFFVHFRAELVPKFWLLTKKVRCRVFQHISVPDILRRVLAGLDVSFEFLGSYHERDFCVQYRESDFDFASRLMEDEGIYYFFKHSETGHQMVVTDVSKQHPLVPGQSQITYEEASGGAREEMRIRTWEKSQEIRSGACTLWDHSFELPDNHLEAAEKTVSGVTVGNVTHKLNLGGNDQLEIYDYPGGYAHHFDGVGGQGASRPQDLQEIFSERERTIRVRMEQEEALSLETGGTSDCGHFVAGHQFTLQGHFDADGEYLLTRVEHDAHLGGTAPSAQAPTFIYENRFTCIPAALPCRSQRVTPKPLIAGIQTATVTGPPGEELFLDKYGRVKVQFHWDREGKNDGNSSCWLRVAQVWAGKRWGAFFWPRIGHEVVVAFEDGDPDKPLIVGSVYNADNMPPLSLPATSMFCGIKSASVRGRASENFNSIVFVDLKGKEHLSLQSERHMILNAELDVDFRAGRHHFERVPSAQVTTVGTVPGGGSGGGGDALPQHENTSTSRTDHPAHKEATR